MFICFTCLYNHRLDVYALPITILVSIEYTNQMSVVGLALAIFANIFP